MYLFHGQKPHTVSFSLNLMTLINVIVPFLYNSDYPILSECRIINPSYLTFTLLFIKFSEENINIYSNNKDYRIKKQNKYPKSNKLYSKKIPRFS